MTDVTQHDCANGEALLEFQLLPTRTTEGNPPRYRASNSNGTIYFECEDCRFDNSNETFIDKKDIKLCLPKKECHHLSVGRGFGRSSGYYQYARDKEEDLFILKWDGEILRRSNAYFFDTVDFGNCQSKCSPDQSEFEFYLVEDPDLNKGKAILSWNLTTNANLNNTLVGGEVRSDVDSFIYVTECVPRNTCLVFTMGYPPVTPTEFYDSSPFSLRLDGVMYRDHKLTFGDSPLLGDKLNETVYLGPCTVQDVCNKTTESLFEAEFRTKETYKPEYAPITFDAIELIEFPFFLDKWDRNVLFLFDGIEVDTSYKILDCIPNNNCTQFCMSTDNDVESYTVKENGVVRSKHVVHAGGYYDGMTTTGLGTCSSSSNHLPQNFGSSIVFGIVMILSFFKF